MWSALVLLAAAAAAVQLDDRPQDRDPRILKQAPHHWGTPAPNSGVRLDFVPLRVLASVRREVSTKHLPRDGLLAAASTPEEIILAQRLKESVTVHKTGEVYTEQGYEDKKYDHGQYEKHGEYKEKYHTHDRGETRDKDAQNSDYYPKYHPKIQAQSSEVKENKKPKLDKIRYDSKKYPFYKTAPKNSPIRYATNPDLLPDKKKSDMPFYESTNYKECPEISPNLKVGPDAKHPPGEPRLKGLGDKIDCLASKYFGEDPFDNPFFQEEEVGALSDEVPFTLTPAASQPGPVLRAVNSTAVRAANKPTPTPPVKKPTPTPKMGTHKAFSRIEPVTARTEHIEGLLPPPLLARYRRDTHVYSTRRGGVRFADDLLGDGSEIESARLVASHRVAAGNYFGAREAVDSRRAESRSRARAYEVTEEPEEPQRFSSRSGPRRVQHRPAQEEVYSSTYVPRGAGEDVMTTTVWNEVTPRNIESRSFEVTTYVPSTSPRGGQESKSRSRARPPVAVIPEDVFQGRGERRKVEVQPKSNSDLLRSRQRTSRVKEVTTTPAAVPVSTLEPQEPFLVPTENIPEPLAVTQTYEVSSTERATTYRQRASPVTEQYRPPTEAIPDYRQTGAVFRPLSEAPESRVPTESRVPESRAPEPRQRTSERRPKPDTPSPLNQADSEATGRFSPRSRSGRLEAIKGRKQDYSARIPSEPSRHRYSPEPETPSEVTRDAPRQTRVETPRQSARVSSADTRSRSAAPSDTPTRSRSAVPRSRHTSRVSPAPLDPLETAEELTGSRRVNRQGSRGSGRRIADSAPAEQQVQASSSRGRGTSRRQQVEEPARSRAPLESPEPTTSRQERGGGEPHSSQIE